MVDHRRTLSRRAYHLPGWFFWLTGLLCVVSLVVVMVTRPPERDVRAADSPTQSAAPSAGSHSPSGPTATPTATRHRQTPPKPQRPPIEVQVLNATGVRGLAASTAKEAEAAGWSVAEVGNWRYGAGHSAVYYPEGSEEAGRQLGRDLGIEAVEPAKPGMPEDQLTVLVIKGP